MVALKKLKSNESKEFISEMKILSNLLHPNIVQVRNMLFNTLFHHSQVFGIVY